LRSSSLATGMLFLLFLPASPAAADPTPLDSPWGLTGAYMGHGVFLAWNQPLAPAAPVTLYHVYRALDDGPFSIYANVTATSYMDPEGDDDTYSYYVTSVSAGVESGPSNEAYGWPHCKPEVPNVEPDDVGCYYPLPPNNDPVSGVFAYRVPIVNLQAVRVHPH
jgi:hypothetical protein